jgi:hypothetical protein
LLVFLVLAVARRRHVANRAENGQPGAPSTLVQGIPAALSVTERELAADGGEPRVLRQGVRLPIVPNAPVSFGTDAGRCTCVVTPIDGIDTAELFSVTPTLGGLLNVRAVSSALCENQAVPRNGLGLAGHQAFRIRVGNREWEIAPSWDATERAAADDLFARIQVNRRASGETVKP